MSFGFGKRGFVQLHQQGTAAAFLCAVTVTRVRQEMFQRAEKKRTKAPLLSIGARIGAGLDQMGEKPLSQILRILRSISLSSQEGVQRAPIDLAQFRERTEG